MNKSDLLLKLSKKLSVSQRECQRHLDAFISIVGEELVDGNGLLLQGFGTFQLWEQASRAGRNPRTGTPCLILPRNSVKFKPGKQLLKRINTKAGEE
ncbi:MAG: DNA-binding protein HU-beta [Parabacteroides sp.]|jgi:DNA-binding protein HU-beta 2